jgi:hypothetical protein
MFAIRKAALLREFQNVREAEGDVIIINVTCVDMGADEVEISFPPGGALMRGGDQMASTATIRYNATARLRLTLPDLVPPVTVSPLYIRRISPIMPTVVGRNSRGEPLT